MIWLQEKNQWNKKNKNNREKPKISKASSFFQKKKIFLRKKPNNKNNKIASLDGFTGIFIEGKHQFYTNSFRKLKSETLPNSLGQISIILIPKPKTLQENHKPVFIIEYRCKKFLNILANRILQYIKNQQCNVR